MALVIEFVLYFLNERSKKQQIEVKKAYCTGPIMQNKQQIRKNDDEGIIFLGLLRMAFVNSTLSLDKYLAIQVA